ncbi:FAD-dependent oxidoreductase [Nonomuraea pusilla]|uniref:2-polyprenyl-6-methoxyphenol hydroxylase n=1 Tax=Nonomuraea pusilla TaxID=46177 RepID=A0A1H8G956_9ACTN|nr:FAD-dependent oxidoreductase [Nonomuraea pusilla]SEN40379.1 2-polyprenyl-6-methoxyphenol hydroxylase [Nonomuraea pusilla]
MKVLIVGAGIAGSALAYWLTRHGADVTLVERAPTPRTGGQAVDIRGAALTVADRMGVLDGARALRTTMRGMSMVDGDGNEIMRSTEETVSAGRLDSDDVEIGRDDLIGLLADAARGARHLYGDSVAALDQDERGVDVVFDGGARARYDHVVGADGLHSAVRALTFGPEERLIRHLGMYVSIFTAENVLGLDRWQVWHREGDAGFGLFSDRDPAVMKVNLGFAAGPIVYDHRDVVQQKRLVEQHCAGLRWEGARLIKAMWEADDFYFDAMAQVRMDRWSRGRVTLVGDAGYCASPLSGQGTSLALVGAYVLAEELAASPEGAFTRYEHRMRPFVAANQALALENPGQAAAGESVARAATAITID